MGKISPDHLALMQTAQARGYACDSGKPFEMAYLIAIGYMQIYLNDLSLPIGCQPCELTALGRAFLVEHDQLSTEKAAEFTEYLIKKAKENDGS